MSAAGDAEAPSVPGARGGGVLRELAADPLALAAALFLLLLVLAAVFAPLVAPHDPAAQTLMARLRPPAWAAKGSWDHLLGTDNLGRDVLSRIIYGARVSLLVGVSVLALASVLGVTLGLLAGYLGGTVETLVMRLVEVQQSFPDMLLALIVLMVLGPSPATVIVVLALTGWMVYARIARGIVVSAKHDGYVEAAEMIGVPPWRVLLRHILPNLAAPLMTLAIVEFARVILSEAALSFLGMGVQPPASSWGLDIAVGKDHIFGAWWLVTFPGAVIALTILSANILATWARTTTDPTEREKRFAAAEAARLARARRRARRAGRSR